MIDFSGQVVIVTGAGRGLGRLYARDIARRGGAVIVNDPGGAMDGDGEDSAVAEVVVSEIEAEGGSAAACYDSVATPEGGEAIVRAALDRYGRVDAVISNAGIFHTAPFEQLSADQWRKMLSVHLDGAFYLAQPAYKAMKAQSGGRFLFIASSAGLFGQEQAAHYGAAKAGTLGLANVIALEGRPHNITANTLLPFGYSRMVVETMGGEAAAAEMPFLRQIDPELVVPMAVFLASKACTLTHHVFSAGAGRYARAFVGLTDGWLAPAGYPVSADHIDKNLDRICNPDRYDIPMSIYEEIAGISTRRGSSQP